MEAARRVLQELEHTASIIGEIGFDDRSWAPWRKRVIAQIERGHRALARIEGTPGEVGAAIRWDENDTIAMLARAFAMVHCRLAVLMTPTTGTSRVGSEDDTVAA